MTLDSENDLTRRLEVGALDSVTDEQLPLVIRLVPEMSNELRGKLFDLVPGLTEYAIQSMKEIEATLQTTLGATGKEQSELHESFGELRAILAGRLRREDISEGHAEFIIEKLMEAQRMETDQKSESATLIADQANATRRAKVVEAAGPFLAIVLASGITTVINRRGPAGGFKL